MSELRYYLKVEVEEVNGEYEQQMADFAKRQRDPYRNFDASQEPRLYRTMNELNVRLTAEQFDAVKRAVLETFE